MSLMQIPRKALVERSGTSKRVCELRSEFVCPAPTDKGAA
jgi:hypothetical protein